MTDETNAAQCRREEKSSGKFVCDCRPGECPNNPQWICDYTIHPQQGIAPAAAAPSGMSMMMLDHSGTRQDAAPSGTPETRMYELPTKNDRALVERLRGGVWGLNRIPLCHEAADHIEHLERDRNRLREELATAKAETQVVCRAHASLGESLVKFRDRAEKAETALAALQSRLDAAGEELRHSRLVDAVITVSSDDFNSLYDDATATIAKQRQQIEELKDDITLERELRQEQTP